MPKFYSFPHHKIDVKDESLRFPLIVEELSLHRPLFLSFAERGLVGQPIYGPYEELHRRFGKGTFDMFSNYYKHPNLFLEKSLQHQKCFFVRLADDTAETASFVLECVIRERELIQYQRDPEGFFMLDTNDDLIPIDDGGVPLRETGNEVRWQLRQLGAGEVMSAINQATSMVPDPDGGADLTETRYPVLAMSATSPGGWGNVTGIKMSWNPESDQSTATDLGALIFTFELVSIPWGFDSPQTVRTKYLDPTTEFTFRLDTTDKDTMRRYPLEEVIDTDYYPEDLVFTTHLYAENVEQIGLDCIASEDTATLFGELIDEDSAPLPFMVNLFSGATMDGVPYGHIIVDDTSPGAVIMDPDVIQYMLGGHDGDLSDATLEDLTREWLNGSVFPEIEDSARYPVTHLYDSGYESETKLAMIDFLGLKDDVKLIMATQSVYEQPNIKSEDQSMGSYLRAKSLLHIESYIFGTQACRVTIMQQCGRLNETTPYTRIVPATLDNMIKKGIWQGATYMKGKPKGLPHSDVSTIRDVNWFPVQKDFKQLSWDAALNYMQYYDMTSYHYPDVISVYPYKTSLLSDDIFIDMLVYIKHIVRFQWAKFAGVDIPINDLIAQIRESVGAAIYKALGNFIRCEVNPYQTDLDKELGYSLTVEIAAYSTVPNRVWNVIIPVRREASDYSLLP